MYHQRETNPHFVPWQETEHQPQPPPSVTDTRILPLQPLHIQHGSGPRTPTQLYLQRQNRRAKKPKHGLALQSPAQQQSHPDLQSPTPSQPHGQRQPSQAHDSDLIFTTSMPQPHKPPVLSGQPAHNQTQQSSVQRIPPPRKTKPFTWCIAILCALFWIIIILGGLIVLIVYLVFHPKSPKFDIAGASLNAAYLDMGYLLNADLTLLANFTNPNRKVNVKFNHIVIHLYHEGTPIATKYVEHFSIKRASYRLGDVHMVTSQVRLSVQHSQDLKKQIENGRVKFEIRSTFKSKSTLGSILRYSYWMYGHCNIVMTGPPGGVLAAKTCTTKR